MKRAARAMAIAALVIVAVAVVLYTEARQERLYPQRILERATDVALEIPAPETRARALVRVAEAATLYGDAERAKNLLRQAHALSRSVRHRRPHIEAEILSAMMRAGMQAEVRSLVRQLSRHEVRTLLNECIAMFTVPPDWLDSAQWMATARKDVADLLKEQCIYARCLEEVAPEAFREELTRGSDLILWTLSKALLEVGRTDEALHLARLCVGTGVRARALAQVAVKLTQSGRTEEANALFIQAIALAAQVARMLGERGEDPPGYTLHEVAMALAETGKHRHAMDMLKGGTAFTQADITMRIACILARKHNFNEAFRLAKSLLVQSPPAQLDHHSWYQWKEVMLCIGEELVEVGREEEAQELGHRLGIYGNRIFTKLCAAKAREGKIEQALQIANTFQGGVRSVALLEIVRELSKMGYTSQALSIARSIEVVVQRDEALAIVAVHLARASRFRSAQRVFSRIQRGETRQSAQCQVAEEMVRAGSLREAERIFSMAIRSAKNNPCPECQSEELYQIVSSLTKSVALWHSHHALR